MQGPIQANPPRALIADDQPAFRSLVCQVVASLPAEVIVCTNGSEALVAFEQHQPDWTLLDWSMPEPDGLAVIRILRDRHPRSCLILLSAHFSSLLEREAEAAGATRCFPKERLLDVLRYLRLTRPPHTEGWASSFPDPESPGKPT